jgi:hypothetical protein
MAEFDQGPILPDTEMSGSDPVASVINPALVPAVNILSNVGSQGVPAPSNAMDARQRATDVSRFLARQMETLAKPDRYGDLINAALMSAANPGRVTVPGALEQAEGQRLTRAYNIANAMAGLGRQVAPGQLTEYQRLQLGKDRTEGAARDRRDWGTRTDAMIRSAVSNLDNPSEGIAFFQKRMEELGATRDSSIADLERISRQIFAEFPRQGFAGKRSRDGEGEGGFTGGPVFENGVLVGFKEIKPEGNRRLDNDQKSLNTVWRNSQDKGPEERIAMMREAIENQTSAATGTPAPLQRSISNYSKSLAETASTIRLVDRLDDQLSSPTATTGAVGGVSIFGEAVASQFDQARRVLFAQPLESRNRETGEVTKIGRSDLESKLGVNRLWERYADGNTKSILDRLGATSEEAQAIRTNSLLLAFSVARAIEPGGRLSDQDVKAVITILGINNAFSSPRNIKAALAQVRTYLEDRVKDNYEQLARQSPSFQRNNPSPPTFGRAPAQPAAAPQAGNAPQSGQSFLSPSTAAIEFLRRNPQLRGDFDKKFGPGAAARVLGD